MRDFMIEIVEDPVREARRYVQNAKDLLRDNGKLDTETRYYQDRKYVRMAGNTLWNPDAIDYKDAIARRDQKLLRMYIGGYEVMHIAMGYDGILNKDISDSGFRAANQIIDRCAAMLPT